MSFISVHLRALNYVSKRWMGYGVAVIAAIAAIEVTRFFQPSLNISAPALLCFLAVIITAWYGGFGAAVLAIAISSLLFNYYFILPVQSLAASPTDLGALGLFMLEATLFAYLIDYLKCSREEATSTKEQLKRLHEHSSSLLREQALEPMFAQVLSASMDLLKAEKACIHLCQPQGGLKLMHEIGFGTNDDVIERLSSVSAEACKQKRRINFDAVAFRKTFSQLTSVFDQHQLGSAQSTPLLGTEGRCFGVLSTFAPSRRNFQETDLAVLDLYLEQARHILAIKLNEDKLRKLSEELEREVLQQKDSLAHKENCIRLLGSDLALMEQRERRQLASELHDYLCQLLALALIKIKQARQSLPPSSSECVHHLQETDEALHRCVSYARSLMAELNPPSLNDSGLPAALRWLAGQMSFHDLAVEVQMSCDTLALSKDQAIVLYRSVRELLINVSKHARVNRARLSVLVENQNLLVISVQDQGRGFDTSSLKMKNPGQNYGLASITERVAAIGGWLKAESLVGRGSDIKLYLPLESVGSESVRAALAVQQERVISIPNSPSNVEQLPLP